MELGVIILLLFGTALVFVSRSPALPEHLDYPDEFAGSAEETPRPQVFKNPGQYQTHPLLTKSEQSFFQVLRQAMLPDYYVLCKVRVADIVQPVRGLSRSNWRTAFNSIAAKHVDFVICGSSDMSVLAVVELDGKSHDTFEQGIRDYQKESYFESAGVPLIRVPVSKFYAPARIREKFTSRLRSKPTDCNAA